MQNKNLAIIAISLGVLALLVLLWAGNVVAGPPMQGPEGGEEGEVTTEGGIEAQGILDDSFWYQGLLTDGSGNPLANTNVNVTFQLYDVPTGGTALDSVVVAVNTDSNGRFNEEIDFGNPDLFNGQALYLGLQVAGEASEMTPRQYLRPVPYAMSIRPGAIISTNTSTDPVLEVRQTVSSTTSDYDALQAFSESGGEGVEGWSQHGKGVVGVTYATGTTDDAGTAGWSYGNSPGVIGISYGTDSSNSYGGYFTSGNRRGLYAKGASGWYDAWFDGDAIYVAGDIVKGGACSAAMQAGDHGVRKLYAMESPNVWLEDFGQAQLVDGQATVPIEPIFLTTISTEVPYHVFVTPLGDCNGLYVTNKTAASFEVHELGGGTSDVAFDYRIVALRKGYETVRMELLGEGGKAQEGGGPALSKEPEYEEP